MESRKLYNYPGVCRLRPARFHVFIIDFQRSHGPESFRDDD